MGNGAIIPQTEKKCTASTQVKNNNAYAAVSYLAAVETDAGEKVTEWKVQWVPTGMKYGKGTKREVDNLVQLIAYNFDPVTQLVNLHGIEAIDKYNKKKAKKNQSVLPSKEHMLFSDCLKSWLEKRRLNGDIEDHTYVSYGYNLRKMIPYFESIPINELTVEHIHGYYGYLKEVHGLKTNTVIRHHANIRTAILDAVRDKNIEVDSEILMKLERPKIPKEEKFEGDFYTFEELNALFEISKTDPLALIIKVAAFYGLRRSEILGLKWNMINFHDGSITVKHTLTQFTMGGKYMLHKKNRGKSEASIRTMPLYADFAQLFRQQLKEQQQAKIAYRDSYNHDNEGYIFLKRNGDLIKPNYVTQHFSLVLEKNGLRHIRFHDLRHSCAHLLIANGVPMKDVQYYLGHAQLATTDKFYAHMEYKSKVASVQTMSTSGLKIV